MEHDNEIARKRSRHTRQLWARGVYRMSPRAARVLEELTSRRDLEPAERRFLDELRNRRIVSSTGIARVPVTRTEMERLRSMRE